MRVDLVLDRRSLSMIQKQQLRSSEQVFKPKWERAEVGPRNSFQEQWPFVSCNICWADKWRSEEEIIPAFPTLSALWKYTQSSVRLKRHHPVLSSLRVFVSAVSLDLQSEPWEMGLWSRGRKAAVQTGVRIHLPPCERDRGWRGGKWGKLSRFSMQSLVLEVLVSWVSEFSN